MSVFPGKAVLRRVCLLTGLLLLCGLAAAVFFLPRVISREMLREKVVSILSGKISGTVDFRDADISLFPLPRVTVHDAGIVMPDRLQGTVRTITVYPKLLPLVFGDVRLSKIQISEPVLSIILPQKKDDRKIPLEDIAAMFKTLTLGSAKISLKIEKGEISFVRNNQIIVSLREVGLSAALTDRDNVAALMIDRLNIRNPGLSISGRISVDTPNHAISIEARGKDFNVREVRHAALSLGGDIPAVARIFDILRAGDVRQITFGSGGTSPEDLVRTPNMRITGRLNKGEIHIPDIGLRFSDVSGYCEISDGILKGSDLAGRMVNSRIRTGDLVIGLQGADPQFHLEASVSADLNDVNAVLKKTVKNSAFLRELELIRSINGRAEGRLVLGESLHDITALVEARDLKFAANYGRVPYEIHSRQGRFSYDGRVAAVRDLNAAIGSSSFSGMNIRLVTAPVWHLTIASGRADLDTGETLRWLNSYEAVKPHLNRIALLKGGLKLSSISFQGPVKDLGKWDFRLAGSVEDLLAGTTLLPGRLGLSSGKFELRPGRLEFSGLGTNFLDSSPSLSGSVAASLESVRECDLRLSGTLGPKAMHWIKETFSIPEYVRTDQSVSVSGAEFRWQKNGSMHFQGSMKTESGQNLDMALDSGADSLVISRLDIEDQVSRASVSLDLRDRKNSISFRGRLDTATAARLVTTPQIQGGMVQGEMSAVFSPGTLVPFSAGGRLRGERIVLPWKKDQPVTIDSIAVSADKKVLSIDTALLRVADSPVSLKGNITARDEGIVMDMDVSSGRIDWLQLSSALDRGNRAGSSAKPGRQEFKLLGKLRLRADTFIYDKLTITGLQTDIELGSETVSAAVNRAAYCNMAVIGSITRNKKEIGIDLKVNARDIDLGPAIACVTDSNAEISGRFDLDAMVLLSGRDGIDPKSLHGNLDFRARDGRIRRFTALAKIFSLLNVTEIFRGRVPDLIGEGFSYRTFAVSGDIKNGKLQLKEGRIDSQSMGIVGEGNIDLVSREADMTILVAPFRTIDAVLNILPGWKGGIVSVPFSVKGSLKDPQVAYMPSSVVRTGLTGFMENLLKAPVKLLQPLLPGEKK